MEDREEQDATQTGDSTPSDTDSPAEMTGGDVGGLSDMTADDEASAENVEASAVTQAGMETGGDPPDKDTDSASPEEGEATSR
jgi:hypothetical protein